MSHYNQVPNQLPIQSAATGYYGENHQLPTIFVHQNSTISQHSNGQRTFVNVEPRGNNQMYANNGMQYAMPYNTPYQMPQMSHYTQQQPQYMQSEGGQPFNMYQGMQSNYPQYLPNVAAQAQPPNSQPSAVPIVDKPQELAPKTKKVIKIINPETHQEVKIDKQTTAKDESPAPPPTEEPVNDINQRFRQKIADSAVTPPPEQPQTDQQPAEKQSTPPATTQATPPPEQTPIERQSTPPPPPKQATPPPEQTPIERQSTPPPPPPKQATPLPEQTPIERQSTPPPPKQATPPLKTETPPPPKQPTPPPSTATSEVSTPDNTSPQKDEEDFTELEEKARGVFEGEADNIKARKYNLSILRMVREIVKRYHKTQPPVDPQQLKQWGLDAQSEPMMQYSRGKYPMSSSNTFQPNWASTGATIVGSNRKNIYAGRHSDNRRAKKNVPPPRPSFDRAQMRPAAAPPPPVEPLRKAGSAWKPKRRNDETEEASEEKQLKQWRKEIRSLLNKITPSTFEQLAEDFYAMNVEEDEQLRSISIDLIFEKAVEEPKFCSLYTNICKGQVDRGTRSTGTFFSTLIAKCQATFEGDSTFSVSIHKTREDLKAETDEKKKEDLQERLDLLQDKEKRCLLGNIKFISHLFRAELIIDAVMSSCASVLHQMFNKTNDEVYIQYGIELLEVITPLYLRKEAIEKRKKADSHDNVQSFIQWISSAEVKQQVSTRVRVMIMNFEDFLRKGYQHRNVEIGPKTITEIHADAKREDEERTKERHAYDAAQQKRSSHPPRNQYAGRPSLERKDPNQARLKAANASQNAGEAGIGAKKVTANLRDTMAGNSGKLGGTKSSVFANATQNNN